MVWCDWLPSQLKSAGLSTSLQILAGQRANLTAKFCAPKAKTHIDTVSRFFPFSVCFAQRNLMNWLMILIVQGTVPLPGV